MEQNVKYKVATPCTIQGVLRMWLNKIGWKIVRKTCRHEEKQKVFDDYTERCTLFSCKDCRSEIYEGWD